MRLDWDEIVQQLAKLFALFFIVQKHNLALKSTGHAAGCFCSAANGCSVDNEKVAQYAKSLLRVAAKQNLDLDLAHELQVHSDHFELTKRTGFEGVHVSGEFILYLIGNRIAKSFDLDRVPDLQSFAYRLAEKCDFSSLRTLKRKVNAYLHEK